MTTPGTRISLPRLPWVDDQVTGAQLGHQFGRGSGRRAGCVRRLGVVLDHQPDGDGVARDPARQVEGQVDARGDADGGGVLPVAYEDRLEVDRDPQESSGERAAVSPVRAWWPGARPSDLPRPAGRLPYRPTRPARRPARGPRSRRRATLVRTRYVTGPRGSPRSRRRPPRRRRRWRAGVARARPRGIGTGDLVVRRNAERAAGRKIAGGPG